MRHNPKHAVTDPRVVRDLIAENPWATIVSHTDDGVAHCYGIPQVLEADENLRVLTRLVEHFEREVDSPVALDQRVGAQLAVGTVGIRLPITRFVCKVKMSQDKDPQTQRQVLTALRGAGPYGNPELADQMERALSSTGP